ncbi:hypothetical protein COLO4_08947 [Corchorus olitorius]|uniref:Uncharacterized protein n=1 Tax=Corchorus olitorius TaxID=93759 RepID=A0A1R3KDX2_9ROSI|nr:hypothetical protein COLO4_08947 [Corchorus olitorius]
MLGCCLASLLQLRVDELVHDLPLLGPKVWHMTFWQKSLFGKEIELRQDECSNMVFDFCGIIVIGFYSRMAISLYGVLEGTGLESPADKGNPILTSATLGDINLPPAVEDDTMAKATKRDAPAVGTHVGTPAIGTHAMQLPRTHDEAPAVGTYAEAPAVGTHVKASAVGTHAKSSAVGTHAKSSAVGTHAEAPAVGTHAKASAVGTHAEVGTHVEAPAIGTHAEAPAVGTHAKASAVGTHSKGIMLKLRIETHVEAPAVGTHANGPAIGCGAFQASLAPTGIFRVTSICGTRSDVSQSLQEFEMALVNSAGKFHLP